MRVHKALAACLAAVFVVGSVDLAAARVLHVTRYHHRVYHRYAHAPFLAPPNNTPGFAAGTALGLVGAGIFGATDAAPGYGFYRPGYYGPGFGAPGY